VPATALPGRLARRHEAAGRATGAAVHLLDLTTDLGVPVYVAISRGSRSTRVGAGASAWASDAAERALDELIQSCGQPADREAKAAAKLAAWPALERCVRLPLTLLRRRAVPLRPDIGDDSAEGGLETVERALGARGLAHHTADIAPAGSLVAVTTTVAPGLERFSLIRHGDPILPTGRGWHLWPSPTTAAAPSY